jgi:hypothetical protein
VCVCVCVYYTLLTRRVVHVLNMLHIEFSHA